MLKLGIACALCALGWGLEAKPARPGPNAGRTAVMVDNCHPEKSGFVALTRNALKRAGFTVVELSRNSTAAAVAARLRGASVVVFQGAGFSSARVSAAKKPLYRAAARRRAAFERLGLGEARKQHKPLFGICRGAQQINAAFGGSVRKWQATVRRKVNKPIAHRQRAAGRRATHTITIDPNSRFARVVKHRTWGVNSFHDYAVSKVAKGFRVVATTADGVVEAIEGVGYPAFAVQFHPEMRSAGDRESQAIFDRLMELVTVR